MKGTLCHAVLLRVAEHVLPWAVLHGKVAGLQMFSLVPSSLQLIWSCDMIGKIFPDINRTRIKPLEPVKFFFLIFF